jgi:hypothetical protein
MKTRVGSPPFIPPFIDIVDLLWVGAEIAVKLVTEF